jgi:hypothetical protein
MVLLICEMLVVVIDKELLVCSSVSLTISQVKFYVEAPLTLRSKSS